MGRVKSLSQDDLRLWAAYGRTLRLLPGKSPIVMPPPPKAVPAPAGPVAPAVPLKPSQSPLAIGSPPPGLDRGSWRKFRVGQIPAERMLDLHGLTAAQAHRATIGFLQQAHARQRRCVEIITGNGDILARELPFWLDAPPLRQLILALVHPGGANTGAVRVLLRRVRP